MERWERERILREGGVGDGKVSELRELERLEEDLVAHPGRGRPLRQRLRNFRPDVDRYVASLGGPLPYMERLREIEAQTRDHERRLGEAWTELAGECRGDASRFARRWGALAARWSFAEVNDLVERHNRYYPAEARLPMDPRTGDFVLVAGESYRKRPLDAAWVLARFPATLGAAAA